MEGPTPGRRRGWKRFLLVAALPGLPLLLLLVLGRGMRHEFGDLDYFSPSGERVSTPLGARRLPAFDLTDQGGRSVGRDDLAGTFWLVAFMTTDTITTPHLATMTQQLLWANWRANNRDFEEFKGEISRLKLVNEGQDETAANNSAQLARTSESLVSAEARMNAMLSDLAEVSESLDSLNGSVANLGALRGDLESIRQALNSGDSTVLGLVGRLEYMEQSMESVNAHRLQINETLFRLQESVESLQRSMSGPAGF